MKSNLLERRALASSHLNEAQLKLDATLENFTKEACNLENIAAMTFGSAVFRLTRFASLSLAQNILNPAINTLSYATALSAEVIAFRSANALFDKLHQRISSENIFNRDGLLRTFTDFLALKSVGRLAAGQNIFLAHTLQTSAMVASRHLNAQFGLLPTSQGTLLDEFLEAENTNIAMGVGQSLFGFLSGNRLHHLEQSMDLKIRSSRQASIPSENVGSFATPLLSMKSDTSLNPREILDQLMAGNERFASMTSIHPNLGQERREHLLDQQNPCAVIIGCSDSRVPPEIIFDQGLGDLFVIRSAGNTLDDLAIGSVEFAVAMLKVRLVMVLGHRDCGAVKAAVKGSEAPSYIQHVVRKIQLPQEINLPPEDLVNRGVRSNVRAVVEALKHSGSILPGLSESGELLIVGAKYNNDTGRVILDP